MVQPMYLQRERGAFLCNAIDKHLKHNKFHFFMVWAKIKCSKNINPEASLWVFLFETLVYVARHDGMHVMGVV